jgi:hypothetical protein
MKFPSTALALWAVRDLLRRPFESLFLTSALALCIAGLGAALMASETLTRTAERLIEQGPAIVVRRVSPVGWEPIPAEEALAIARSVPGVTDARVRIWGTAGGPDGPVTIVGAGSTLPRIEAAGTLRAAPSPGEAVVGRAVTGGGETVDLFGLDGKRRFRVVGVFESSTDAATFDLVVLQDEDAGALLGIPRGRASDLAIDVFHDAEAEAMARELSHAFPWPVQVTTRLETLKRYRSAFGLRSGIAASVYIPTLLAMGLVAAATLRDRIRNRREIGLLKALGWTAADTATLELWRTATVAATAAAAGGSLAYGLVFGPGGPWLAGVVFGWRGPLPDLALDPAGAGWVFVEVTAIVLLPFVGAALGPLLLHAAQAPEALMAEKTM